MQTTEYIGLPWNVLPEINIHLDWAWSCCVHFVNLFYFING